MGGSFTVVSHTADTGIDVAADSLGELFEWAGHGMFSTMYDIAALTPIDTIPIAVSAGSRDELLVDVLSELLYMSEARDIVPCTFAVEAMTESEASLSVGIVPLDEARLIGPPIKAVTYHELAVAQQPDGTWRGRVIFDV